MTNDDILHHNAEQVRKADSFADGFVIGFALATFLCCLAFVV